MSRVAIGLLFLLAGLWNVGHAETILSTLSDDHVDITSNFTGERITVFGVVRRDRTSVGRAGMYEVAVILEGPHSRVRVRLKSQVFGIWINRRGRVVHDVPAFYALHLSSTLDSITSPAQRRARGVGLDSFPFVVRMEQSGDENARPFIEALLRLRQEQGLFEVREEDVDFLTPMVFKTAFRLPADVPLGTYRVRVLLFRDGAFLAEKVDELTVSKRGLGATVTQLAAQQGFIYGILALLLALFTSWVATLVFGKD